LIAHPLTDLLHRLFLSDFLGK
jgi:hypothetical protein